MNNDIVIGILDLIKTMTEKFVDAINSNSDRIENLEKKDKKIKELEGTVASMKKNLDKLMLERNSYNRFEAMEIVEDDE